MRSKGKSKVAFLAAILATTSLLLSGCSTGGYGTDAFPNTTTYLYKKFTNGQFIAPYKKNQPDMGATLEAMIALTAVGYGKEKQTKAIEWIKKNPDLLMSNGFKGEFVFASHALGFSTDPSVMSALTKLKSAIEPDYSIHNATNYETCWAILGLVADGQKDLANKIALKLTDLAELDGGYKYLTGDRQYEESADVTSFMIIAVGATSGFGSSQDEAAKTFAMGRAKNWLLNNLHGSDRWVAMGGDDMAGTAYAISALGSLGVEVSPYYNWYTKQINAKDYGVIAPWSDPDSDLLTTTQSILALNKLSFLDILKHMNN